MYFSSPITNPFTGIYPYINSPVVFLPYTIIGDLIGANKKVEDAILEAYKDPSVDVEFDRLKKTLDKDGNGEISYREWNQVVDSFYTAVKLESEGKLKPQVTKNFNNLTYLGGISHTYLLY